MDCCRRTSYETIGFHTEAEPGCCLESHCWCCTEDPISDFTDSLWSVIKNEGNDEDLRAFSDRMKKEVGKREKTILVCDTITCLVVACPLCTTPAALLTLTAGACTLCCCNVPPLGLSLIAAAIFTGFAPLACLISAPAVIGGRMLGERQIEQLKILQEASENPGNLKEQASQVGEGEKDSLRIKNGRLEVSKSITV